MRNLSHINSRQKHDARPWHLAEICIKMRWRSGRLIIGATNLAPERVGLVAVEDVTAMLNAELVNAGGSSFPPAAKCAIFRDLTAKSRLQKVR
jgi:hypothetical protein